MRNFIVFLILFAVASAGLLLLKLWSADSDSVSYQGERIKLSKSYSDYDDYKNDPDNLAPGDVKKAQQLVQSAPIARRFSDRSQMIDAVSRLQFPGYGMTIFGQKSQPDGSVLELQNIEIPQSGNSRFLLFRGIGSSYTLIDDFVYPDNAVIDGVTMTGDKLLYVTRLGAKVVERTASIE